MTRSILPPTLIQPCFAIIFGWAAVIEMAHARKGLSKKDVLELVGPFLAAACLLFMASEAYQGSWEWNPK